MKQLTITAASFTEWYFTSGSDQEQEAITNDLGNRIREALYNNEQVSAKISIEDLFFETEHDVIPLKYTEEYTHLPQENTDEIGETFPKYELKLLLP